MNEIKESKSRINNRRGIFWPLILIILGIILLLKNTGILQGDILNSLIQFWPVILILMGLDSIFRREGWIGSTLLIALGVVFLLSNLGYFSMSVWEVLLRLWPLFLLAAGLDILVGKRSWLLSLLGLLFILLILGGSLWLLSGGVVSVEPITTSQVQQSLEGANSARVEINIPAGSIKINETNNPDLLLEGTFPGNENYSMGKDFTIQDGKAALVLRSTGDNSFWMNSNQSTSNIRINSQVPLDLIVKLGAGEINLDLQKFYLSAISAEMAVGETTINLPTGVSFNGSLRGAIGQIVIKVPQDVGLRVVGETGLVNIQTPAGFSKENGVYTSANFEQMDSQIQISVGLAIGSVIIQVQ